MSRIDLSDLTTETRNPRSSELDAMSTRDLVQAMADEDKCVVIDPYLIDVTDEGGTYKPTSIRESIRAFGPTV